MILTQIKVSDEMKNIFPKTLEYFDSSSIKISVLRNSFHKQIDNTILNMENPELANTSTKLDKKKKSKLYSDKHGGSSDQESFLHVDADVKPRRSFWKNLFRKQPKKTEVPEMVTDQKAGVLTSRLNAIFEEPKTPEEKEHVVEEIEDIKKTLKKISPVPDTPPSVLLAGIIPPSSTEPVPPATDEPLLEYLSDGSTSSEDVSVASLPSRQSDTAAVMMSGAAPAAQTRDSLDAFITKLTPAEADAKKLPEQCDNSLGRDGYSFEYSETSDVSTTDDDNKENKVLTFDEKVEQKDADSNIVVRELNPCKEDQQQQQQHEVEEVELLGPDREEVVTGNGIVLVLPTSKIPVAIPVSHDQQQQQQSDNLSQNKRFKEDMLPISGSTQTEVAQQWAPGGNVSSGAAATADSVLVETEIKWNRKLHELSCTHSNSNSNHSINKTATAATATATTVLPTAIDIELVDETEAGYREYRLDDFFKMIFHQSTTDEQLLNYSVAYDPVFANIQTTNAHLGEIDCPYNSDKQKVVRKRKMMSLLHDKTKMAEYLKEIEQQQQQQDEQQQVFIKNTCNTPFNSPNKQESTTIRRQQEHGISVGTIVATAATAAAAAADDKNDEENVLFLLENTKQKLQKYLDGNNETTTSKVPSLNPDKNLDDMLNMSVGSDDTRFGEDLPMVAHRIKQFQNIGDEIDTIFDELLVNIAELKDTCIMHGATYDAQTEPLITMTPVLDDVAAVVLDTTTTSPVDVLEGIVQPVLDELLERVYHQHNHSTLIPHQFHVQSLHNNNHNDDDDVDVGDDDDDDDDADDLNKSKIVRKTAENLVENIEQSLERSKKFGRYYDEKPGDECRVVDSTKFPHKQLDKSLPEMTDSLQHIFFGTENSGQEVIHSEFNLIVENYSPRPGTSKNINTSLPHLPSVPSTDLYNNNNNNNNNTTTTTTTTSTNTSNHEINALKMDSNLETLVENRFSGLTGSSSVQEDIPLDLVTFPPDACGSGFSTQVQTNENLQLERKSPEINLFQSSFDDTLLINGKAEIEKSIEENLKSFQESMNKITKTNAKTVEMLSSSPTTSCFSTPDGSLSILSTITENILESVSRASKTSDDRYPQFIARPENNRTEPPKYHQHNNNNNNNP